MNVTRKADKKLREKIRRGGRAVCWGSCESARGDISAVALENGEEGKNNPEGEEAKE